MSEQEKTQVPRDDESLMPATNWREFDARSFVNSVLVGFVGFLVVVYGLSRMLGFAPPEPAPGWTYMAIGALLFSEAVRNHD